MGNRPLRGDRSVPKIQLSCNVQPIDQGVNLQRPGHAGCFATHPNRIPQRQRDTPRKVVDPIHRDAVEDHGTQHSVSYLRVDGFGGEYSIQAKHECKMGQRFRMTELPARDIGIRMA